MTIKDIARQVGVSTATVSRALNDQPGVSPDVREQILKAAQKEGYHPNLHARGLATSITQTVGFVVSKAKYAAMDDPFYPLIMAGAQAFLSEQDYHLMVGILDEKMVSPEDLPMVKQGLVDGLILAGPFIPTAFITALAGRTLPFVLVDNNLSHSRVNCVLNDDESGTYSAVRHLIEHGYTEIAFLSGPDEWVSNRERLRGYLRAMEEAGCDPHVLRGQETTITSGELLMRRCLEEWPGVTAVCGVNDSVAIGAIRAARALGRETPRDLAVMGFDDISWAAANQPTLSTVRVYKERIGYLAAQCLVNSIRDPGLPPVKTLVTTELVIRESCGCPARGGAS